MSSTFFEVALGVIAPELALRRIKARAELLYLSRSYEAAESFNSDDWSFATNGSAQAEITSAAQKTLRAKARAAIRDNAYAGKALNSIVANVVGPGIVPKITGKNENQVKQAEELWKVWAESTLCDADGIHDFYGLQALICRSMVESGEVFVKKVTKPDAIKLKILESDHLDVTQDTGNVVTGVQLDNDGVIVGYHLFNKHPGSKDPQLQSYLIPKEQVAHVFRMDRPGQIRGVTWYHSVLRTLEDLKNYQTASLIRQKIAACFAAFIQSPISSIAISNDKKIEKRKRDAKVVPGMFKHLDPGETVSFSNPPGVTGYSEFISQVLGEIAAGLGITQAEVSGDYSQFNFSSGRMAHLSMRRNVDMWQWQTFIPRVCNFGWATFLEFAMRKMNIDGLRAEWVPPAPSMIDPIKEIAAQSDAVRNGFKSTPQVIRESGNDPDTVLAEQKAWNEKLDENELILDSDPRKVSKAGQTQSVNNPQQNGDTNNATQDGETEDKAGTNTGGDDHPLGHGR